MEYFVASIILITGIEIGNQFPYLNQQKLHILLLKSVLPHLVTYFWHFAVEFSLIMLLIPL